MSSTFPFIARSGRDASPLRWLTVLAAALLALSFALGADEEKPGADATTPRTAVPAFRQANVVAVLSVEGEIDHLTLRSIERRIEEAMSRGATAIVIELDTPGGRMDATLDICNLLKDPSITPPNTVAWIHPQAFSAGTIIALACREIVVAPNATFGDAAPIQAIPAVGLIQMAPAERAKIEAPILAEVIDSARRSHYDENLVQAFVSVGVELWLIENVQTRERVLVDRQEYRRVFGEDPSEQLTTVTPSPATVEEARRLRPQFQTITPPTERAESEVLTPEQIREEIERQQQLGPSRQPLTEADRGQWRPLRQVAAGDRLLTVKALEALDLGLAVASIATDAQLRQFFGAQTLVRLDRTWSEGLVRFLVSLPVRIVLIVIFLLGLFLELAAPGLGVFGATSVVALLVLIGAPYLAGMAQWWDILLIVVGILLLAIEILVIPGVGVAGFAGALCLLAGIVGTFVSGDLTSNEGQSELGAGIASTLTALFAAGVGMWLVSRHIHSFPVIDRLMLKAEVKGGPGTGPDLGLLGAMGTPQRVLAVGDEGIAETDLRPSGRGSFDRRMVDVQTPGSYIEKGSRIRVTTVDRYVIEVEGIDP